MIMKKILTLSLAAASVLLLASCNKEENGTAVPLESYTVSIGVDLGPATRAEAYLDEQDYEKAVVSVQYLIFDGDGKLAAYRSVTTKDAQDFNLKKGEKTVYAVVNGADLSSVTAESGLLGKVYSLTDDSTDASRGFQMVSDKYTVTVGKSTPATTVKVHRVAARVALVSVKNNLSVTPGALKIERVWLSNVAGEWSAADGFSAGTWYNKQGRSDDTQSHIIDGSSYRAQAEALTYRSIGEDVAKGGYYQPDVPDLVYGYPNSSDVTPEGWSASWPANGQRSLFVIAASVDGTLYYYPIVINSMESNKTYTIYATISNIGSDDPNKPITSDAASINIEVDPWVSGEVLEPNM
jgi:hypothetical protein